MTETHRLLKKHANRRLYDTARKRYVSLEETRDLICEGTDIRVEESGSGDDITQQLLLQIMAECEQDGRPMLSSSMLMSLIRQYGHPLQDFVGPFLERSLGYYMKQEARVRRSVLNILPDIEPGRATTRKARDGIVTMRDALMQTLKSGKSD